MADGLSITAEQSSDIEGRRLHWCDVPLSLLGQREAILRCVDARHGLVFTGLLVLSAAVAREYDGVSLLHRPTDLLGPFAASLILATILYIAIQACRQAGRAQDVSAWADYRRLLVGYWLTAPLAWLYAIPVESFASELFSVKFNLTLLAVVSVWRVLLFSRITSVITGVAFWITLCWIGLVSCGIALVALVQSSLNITGIMGGLRLTETEQVMLTFQNGAMQFVFFTCLALAAGWVASLFYLRQPSSRPVAAIEHPTAIAPSAWLVVVLAFVTLGAGLMVFQPNLFRSARVDHLLQAEGDLVAAIHYMARHEPTDFPRHWTPPPRKRGGFYTDPQVSQLVSVIAQTSPPTWVSAHLLSGAPDILLSQHRMRRWDGKYEFQAESPERLNTVLETLLTLRQLDCLSVEDRKRNDQLIDELNTALAKYNALVE